MRGGARAGAGRPKKPEEQKTYRHTIQMTPPEWAIYQAEGGTKTLRDMINKGQFKKSGQ